MPGISPYYQKEKDLFIQRRTSDGRFEEWGVTVQPNSWLVLDGCSNLISLPFTQYSASFANSSSWAATASFFSGSISDAVNAQVAISASYAQTASWALNAINGGTTLVTGSSYPITASWAISASWASQSVSSSYPWSVTGSNVYITGSNIGINTNSPNAALEIGGDLILTAVGSVDRTIKVEWPPSTVGSSVGSALTVKAADGIASFGNQAGGALYLRSGDGAGITKTGGSIYIYGGVGSLISGLNPSYYAHGPIVLAYDPVGDNPQGRVSIGGYQNNYTLLMVHGNISASIITASLLLGTASFAISASWAPDSGTSVTTGSLYPITSSWAETASLAMSASKILVTGIASNTPLHIPFVGATSAYQSLYTDSGGNILYNPATNSLQVSYISCSGVTGSLMGTASQATSASYAITSSWASGSNKVWIDSTASNVNYYIPFVEATGIQSVYIDTSSIYYNPGTDLLVVNYISSSGITASALTSNGQLFVTASKFVVSSSEGGAGIAFEFGSQHTQAPRLMLRGSDRSATISPFSDGLQSGLGILDGLLAIYGTPPKINLLSINGAATYGNITSDGNNKTIISPSASVYISKSLEVETGLTVPNISCSYITASLITASLFGTASWATSASHASASKYIEDAIVARLVSYDGTTQTVDNEWGVYNAAGAGIQLGSGSTTYIDGDTYIGVSNPTGSVVVVFSSSQFYASGSLYGTSSWALNAVNGGTQLTTGSRYPITASWAESASWAPGGGTSLTTGSTYPITSSWAESASYSYTASYAFSASYEYVNIQLLNTTWSVSSSWASSSVYSDFATSASWASYSMVTPGTMVTGSTYPITASWAGSASWANLAPGMMVTGSSYPITTSWANDALTASYFGLGTNGFFPIWQNNRLSTTSSLFSAGNKVALGYSDPSSLWARLEVYENQDTASVNIWRQVITASEDAYGLYVSLTSDVSNSQSYAQYISLRHNAGWTTNAVGSLVSMSVDTNGTVESLYGIKILRLNNGIITSSYGIYISSCSVIAPSASYGIYQQGNTELNYFEGRVTAPNITGSVYGTSSWAVSASWAPGGGTSLTTGSTYPITASWAESASWARETPGTMVTGSIYPITASWAESASWASAAPGTMVTGSTYPITASMAISAAWATNANTSSYAISSSVAETSSYTFTASNAITASTIRFGEKNHIILDTPYLVKGYKDVILASSYSNALTLNLGQSHSVYVSTTINGFLNSTSSIACDSKYFITRNGPLYTNVDGFIIQEAYFPDTYNVTSRLYNDINPNNIYIQYKLPGAAGTFTGVLNYEVRGLFDYVDRYVVPPIDTPDTTYGTYADESGSFSPFEFVSLVPMTNISDSFSRPFSDSTGNLSYDEMVNHCVSMSNAYPSRVTYDNSITCTNGVDKIPILKIDDDGFRPILLIYHGVHGSEQASAHGLFRFLYDYLDNNVTESMFVEARERLALLVVTCVNPDGWKGYRRYTTNGVDINRNCIYGWAQTVDSAKGSSPNSEENGLLRNYLYSSSYYNRIITSVDSHGWGFYGQWWWGYLVQQTWYNANVQRAQRSHYLYNNLLMDQRSSSNWYSGSGLSIGLRGYLGMRYAESRGSLKPYVNNNGIEFSDPNYYRILVEHPQVFTGSATATGSLGQSSAICSIGKYDSYHSALGCAVDLYTAKTAKVSTYIDCPKMVPINSNSLFADWNQAAVRPEWTIFSRVQLSQHSESGQLFTRVAYPSFSAWPQPFSEAGYITMSYGGQPYIIIAGGNGNVSSYNPTIYTENLETGDITLRDNVAMGKALALATDHSTYIWRIGGFTTGSTYLNRIDRCTLTDFFTGSTIAWQTVATMSRGIQRHTAHYWHNSATSQSFLLVVGGRDSASYYDEIYKYRVDDDSYTETTMSSLLSTPRGWHASCISASCLFVFGGWNGSTTYNGVRKIDLINDSASNQTVLPATRKQIALATDPEDPDIAYIIFGGTGATNVTSSIYSYNMATSTVSTYTYTVDNGTEENISGSEDVGRLSPATVMYGDFIYLYGGQDTSSVDRSDTYELNVNDNTLANRLTDASSYGYLKVSNHTAGGQFANTVPGDIFTAVVDIRRASGSSGSNPDGVSDPYIRMVWKTGADSYNPLRKSVSAKFVPPNSWTRFSLPLIITSSAESTIQGPYIRTYTKGQTFDIRGFQVYKGNIGAMHRMVPFTGSISGSTMTTASRVFNIPLVSGNVVDRTIRFEPFFGAGSRVDTNLLNFDIDASSTITTMSLHYSSSMTSSINPSVTLDYATWNDSIPTGQFTLRWRDDAGTHTQSLLANCELNYAADRLEGYRRDSVSLRLSTHSGSNDMTASLWFRGKMETLYITKSIFMTGCRTTGVGMLLYA